LFRSCPAEMAGQGCVRSRRLMICEVRQGSKDWQRVTLGAFPGFDKSLNRASEFREIRP